MAKYDTQEKEFDLDGNEIFTPKRNDNVQKLREAERMQRIWLATAEGQEYLRSTCEDPPKKSRGIR